MAGHNKWSSIKHKKAKTDAQRGKLFSKISRELMMAAKLGGDDVDMNPRLRLVLQKAKEANMPNDNVKRAIAKGAGGGSETELEELTFEAYGPHGVALLIGVLTDNRNRSVANVKLILNKNGANMAQKGAVSYLFETKGLIYFEAVSPQEQDRVIDLAIEAGADDVETGETGDVSILTPLDVFDALKTTFDGASLQYTSARLEKYPATTVPLGCAEAADIDALVEKLDDDDDVQDVATNMAYL